LVAKIEPKTTSNSQEKTMIISDISHIEVAAEDNQVLGGSAIADADASASAFGRYFAGTDTETSTYASSYYSYFGGTSNSASSRSSSNSAAY
jgi:hypothetical protein